MSKNLFTLYVLSAIAVGGVVIPAGSLVEVNETEAKRLLERKKARLATEGDAAASVKAATSPSRNTVKAAKGKQAAQDAAPAGAGDADQGDAVDGTQGGQGGSQDQGDGDKQEDADDKGGAA